MKIVIFLFLFLPYFAFSFITDVPYVKTEVCEKINSDYSKAFDNLYKTIDNLAKSSGDLTHPLKSYDDFSKVHANLSKILSDGLKHKCFKETPDCIKSVKALSKVDAQSSKFFADLSKTLAKTNNSPKEVLDTLSKADAYSDKAGAISDKAASDMRKYCSDKAKPQSSKIKKLLKRLKELLSF